MMPPQAAAEPPPRGAVDAHGPRPRPRVCGAAPVDWAATTIGRRRKGSARRALVPPGGQALLGNGHRGARAVAEHIRVRALEAHARAEGVAVHAGGPREAVAQVEVAVAVRAEERERPPAA